MFHVKQNIENFDVIVIGGGHAGVEAAIASNRLGAKTAIVTFSKSDLGAMSCNPAMGGLGKGHLIKEIDALGGVIGLASDAAGIQFRLLNRTRGEAVRGPRAQMDRDLYKKKIKKILKLEKIKIIEDELVNINLNEKKQNFGKKEIQSIELSSLGKILCKCLIITTGTFLKGKIHCGKNSWAAGRLGSRPSIKLANFFKNEKFCIKRLKTGTPPRILSESINFKKCIVQPGDKIPEPFSFLTKKIQTKQIDCYITHTSSEGHKIIKENILFSPIYSGAIKSKGPRYCPSIEDKIIRFSEKKNHQIFLEPETRENKIIYPNGISTALPKEVQEKFLKTIPGLENAIIDNYGYAIEYDSINSNEIEPSFETKKINGLFLAGQINGTTGYEEAAAQGLLAGVNAANKIMDRTPFVLTRSEAYLGVLTDDLIKGGFSEPYRMFTSRAEYRIQLRSDNADERLTDKSIKIGLACNKRKIEWLKKKDRLAKAKSVLLKNKSSPQKITAAGLKTNHDGRLRNGYEVLGCNNSSWNIIMKLWPKISAIKLNKKEKEQLRVNAFYQKYISRQNLEIESLKNDSRLLIKENLDFSSCPGLSTEIKDVLNINQPKSIGEASMLPGMTPAAASLLLRYLKKS